MKALFTSRIAQWAAGLSALIVGWFVGQDIIATPDAAKATDELTLLLNGLFAAGFAVLAWLAGIFIKKLTGRDSGGSGTGNSGGMSPCFLVTAAALLMAVALPSCSSLSLTGDGCVRTTQTRDGKTYTMDVCLGADGKVERVRLLWTNETGRELRGTIYRDDRPVVIEFRDLDTGFWYQWTEGMGISLGAIPPEVETALENAVPLPVKAEK